MIRRYEYTLDFVCSNRRIILPQPWIVSYLYDFFGKKDYSLNVSTSLGTPHTKKETQHESFRIKNTIEKLNLNTFPLKFTKV